MTTPLPFHSHRRGITLLLALFVIVLLAGLLITFLSRARSVRQGGALHLEATQSRQYAESAAQLVMARIRNTTLTGSGEAWASQPGALRVYGADGGTARIRKLYSAPEETADDDAGLAADLPAPNADWEALPHQWTDLNRPFMRDGQPVFPIVDPRLASGGNDAPSGFSYSAGVQGVVSSASGTDPGGERLPMPVQWLYLLSNGETVAPTATDGDEVVTLPVPPDAHIIGRIAFWADDETSKINLNTAAGGAFWDTPRINSAYERSLANSQPVQGEFQRYPGHPATVDLRAVFPWLSDAALYALAPRIQNGGSMGGTVTTSINSKPDPIAPDTDRLYATTAEARFDAARVPYAADDAFGSAFADRLRQGDFLLTTASRAPELNLFGHPRVSMWPLATDPADRSPLDRVLAMCASMKAGGKVAPYYFQREAALSPTHDYEEIERNRQLLAYLRAATGTAIPGFGGDFATKYGGPVRDQILTEIFDYIRATVNLKDPLGRKYADPVPYSGTGNYSLEAGEGQVAPIRIEEWKTQGLGRFFTVSEAFLWFTWQGKGDDTTIPGDDTNPATAPATPLPAEPPPEDHTQVQAVFALQFAGAAVGYSEMAPEITIRIRGLDQLRLNGEPLGFPADDHVTLAQALQTPQGGIYDLRGMVRNKRFTHDPDAEDRFPFYSHIIAIPNRNPENKAQIPLSRIASWDADGAERSVTPVTIAIYSGSEAKEENLVQEIALELPIGAIRPPKPPAIVAPENKHNNTEVPRRWGTGTADNQGNPRPDRFVAPNYGPGGYIDWNDVIRSMTCASGDHRMTAALRNVPASFFIPHRGWQGTDANAWRGTANNVGTLITNLGYSMHARTYTGKLFADQSDYASGETRVQLGTHIKGKPAGATSWDFDIGTSREPNGPFINKPDEGSLGAPNKAPYYGGQETVKTALDETMFTPNRQIPSAAMLGSLPSGVNPARPEESVHWQTLQFRPDPVDHPGNTAPADHLLLDLFRMPIVEPYALSEPFSTAGKVNMNSSIAPFGYITRETALHAALREERILALKTENAGQYKGYGTNTSPDARLKLDIAETLKGFHQRFDAGRLFVSPSEICTLYLVPQGQTLAAMPAFWETHAYTGDNVRERPYANLLAKLTTRSNTYSVHLIAQALHQRRGNPRDRFGAEGDRVVSEWAGTYLIERFLDPNDPRLSDVAATDFENDAAPWNDPARALDRHYQMRVLQIREWR